MVDDKYRPSTARISGFFTLLSKYADSLSPRCANANGQNVDFDHIKLYQEEIVSSPP